MSDWGDEDVEVIAGKGFDPNDNYKGDDYQSGGYDEDNNECQNNVYYGRGRSGGRGDRNAGNGYDHFKDNNGNGERRESNAMGFVYENSTFAFIPKDFEKSSVMGFLAKIRNLLKTADYLQMFNMVKYVMKAYEMYLKNEDTVRAAPVKHKSSTAPSFTMPGGVNEDLEEDGAVLPFTEDFDLIEAFHHDLKIIELSELSGKIDLISDLGPGDPNRPSLTITDMLAHETDGLQLSNVSANVDLEFRPIPEKSKGVVKEQDQIAQSPKRMEKRRSCNTSSSRRTLLPTTPTPSSTPKEPPPVAFGRTKKPFLTEDEYRLRFPLPRRRFLPICKVPAHHCNVATSSFSFFPLNQASFETDYDPPEVVTDYGEPNTRAAAPAVTAAAANSAAQSTSLDTLPSMNVARQHGSVEYHSAAPSGLNMPSATGLISIDLNEIFEEKEENDLEASSLGAVHGNPVDVPDAGEGIVNLGEQEEGIQVHSQTARTSIFQFPRHVSADSGTLPALPALDASRTNVEGGATGTSASGLFVSPIGAQAHGAPVSTLPSVKEEVFRRTLLQRTMRESVASTPLGSKEGHHKAYLENLRTTRTGFGQQPLPIAAKPMNISNIEERPETAATSSGAIVPVDTVVAAAPLQVADEGNDYRKDWYEILRAREADVNYVAKAGLDMKQKRRKRKPQSAQAPAQAISSAVPPTATAAGFPLLQEALLDVIPPLPRAQQAAQPSIGPAVSAEQQQYDQFILNNSDNLGKIMDNLDGFRSMLTHLRCGIRERSNDRLRGPKMHYDPLVLLNADPLRLAVKLGVLRAIVCHVSFDLTKLECVAGRVHAAIAFAFVLELKSAGIVRLAADGRSVALV